MWVLELFQGLDLKWSAVKIVLINNDKGKHGEPNTMKPSHVGETSP